MEVGKLELEAIDFSPRDVVDEIADMLGWQAYEKGLSYAGIVSADVPAMFGGDPGRIRQVLLNLVGNAIKFTASGRVEVRVTTAGAVDGGQQSVRWAVHDTGVGIPAAKQGLLFRSFSQVDTSTTRRYGGTGLGLAISKQLVELMGGRIGCESAEGEGATFWLEIPLAVGAGSPACDQPRRDAAPVLMVSCDDLEHEVVDNYLRHSGRRLVPARSSAECLAVVAAGQEQGGRFSAIIIGGLPGMEDPAELARQLGGHGGSPVAPLVLLSDLGDRMDRRQLSEYGFHSVLIWPVRFQRLEKVLEELKGALPGPVASVVADPVPAPAGDGPPHLLLAEDNPVNQRVAGLILAKLGFTYDVVGTGTAAVEAVRRRHYDVVLMDVQMPEMDGLQATRVIRDPAAGALNPLVPILAMTAHAMASDRNRCLEAGMNDHLTKPIQSVTIAEALGKYVGVPLTG
jgi:CheY-like chemotaxis protein